MKGGRMKTKEVIASVESIIDCFEICRVHKKEVYVPIDEEDVEALKAAIAALERTQDAEGGEE